MPACLLCRRPFSEIVNTVANSCRVFPNLGFDFAPRTVLSYTHGSPKQGFFRKLSPRGGFCNVWNLNKGTDAAFSRLNFWFAYRPLPPIPLSATQPAQTPARTISKVGVGFVSSDDIFWIAIY